MQRCPRCTTPTQYNYQGECPICYPPAINGNGELPLLWEILRRQSKLPTYPRALDTEVLAAVVWLGEDYHHLRDIYIDDDAKEIAKRISLWN